MKTEHVFEAVNIVKRFGRSTVLSGIDLTLGKGEFLTVFGANGAGKTTFLKIAASLLYPSEGNILLNGKDVRKTGESIRADLGFISHDTFLYQNLTASENLRFFASMYDLENIEELIENNLKAVALNNRADDIVRGYSRGMQQRLTIARAFMHDPSLLLLDEPYTGLDSFASGILNKLLGLFRNSDRTGILTTHNIEQGYDIATSVAVLHKGRIIYYSPTKDVTLEEFKRIYINLMEENDN